MKIQQIVRLDDDFQQPVDEQALQTGLCNLLPNHQIVAVTELGSGLFNNTYKIETNDDVFVLKIAPKATMDVFYNEQLLMQREAAVAAALHSSCALIPPMLATTVIDARQASVQPWIAGDLWHDLEPELTESESDQLWRQLGKFAATLHSTTGEHFGYPEPFNPHNTWSSFINSNVAGMICDVKRLKLYCSEIEDYCALLPKFSSLLDEIERPCLLHGDLWPRNIIVNGRGDKIAIRAVIDGERAFWGDPYADWVLILYGVPESFWCVYGRKPSGNDLRRIEIYKGMYFILNILETTRFNTSTLEVRKYLAQVNERLRSFLAE